MSAKRGASGPGVEDPWDLVLFVVSTNGTAGVAQSALEQICDARLPGHWRIEVVDILADPDQADAFDVVAVPTVVRRSPQPERRVIGDLSDSGQVVAGLGLPSGNGA